MENDCLRKTATLIHHQPVADGIYKMTLYEPDLAIAAQPGQFAMFSLNGEAGLFLRRPFSFADIDRDTGTVAILYQVTGKGTKYMAEWETGRLVDVLGPLGRGFTIEEHAGRAILAGGGMGIAPLLFLARELSALGKDLVVFAGARSSNLLFGISQFQAFGCRIQIATEDGSDGAKGFVTLPLEDHLKEHARGARADGNTMLYACGPAPFLQAVAGLCERYHQEAEISLEERMGCGFGVCMGCSVQIRSADGTIRQKRVCHDGPVFTAGEVLFHG